MLKNRHPFLLPAITLFVGLPATLTLVFYLYTHDPTLRPLGVSRSDAEKFDRPLADLEVVISVFWGGNSRTSLTKQDLEHTISNALKIYGVNYRMRWGDNLGDQILASIRVDHIEFGPFPIQDLAGTIPAAISAYRSIEN